MRIYRMTATFGKLEHQTLELKPGLNVITAPNEWGKSTWCAFLVAMLYGVETRTKSTKALLADKERYAPWSGSPMAGSIDLEWQGRKITIQRTTKGRIPMGVFHAYETETGLTVPELTGENCGQMLLGVERSVFTRSCLIRLSDLPVTQDEALRRQLNALVTTGDESSDADHLAAKLRDAMNACQSNRVKGRLPEARRELELLQSTLLQMDNHQQMLEECQNRIQQTQQEIHALENHQQALDFARSRETAQALAQAQDDVNALDARLFQAQEQTMHFPPIEEVLAKKETLHQLQTRQIQLQAQEQALPAVPPQPPVPAAFTNVAPDSILEQVRSDTGRYITLYAESQPKRSFLPLAGLLLLLAAGGCLFVNYYLAAAAAMVAAGCFVAWLILGNRQAKLRAHALEQLEQLCAHYGANQPDQWLLAAQEYLGRRQAWQAQAAHCAALQADIESKRAQLAQAIRDNCPNGDIQQELAWLNHVQEGLQQSAALSRQLQQAMDYAQKLRSIHKPALPPMGPDELTLSAEETQTQLRRSQDLLRQLRQRAGVHQGALDTLGHRQQLSEKKDALESRIQKLELTYKALVLAQEKLTEATAQLQRRFAPQISKNAAAILSELTDGRYDRLTMDENLVLSAATTQDTTLRSLLWRSEGTVDQLYLALRLAVAEQLAPNTPLILDDALARFDDQRTRHAMDLLRQLAGRRQVILFSCHSRESA